MKGITIDCAIVIYNMSAESSKSCIWAVKNPFHRIYLMDNSSTESYRDANREFARVNEWHYVYIEGNKGLATAYNAAKKLSQGDYLCLLDDDSQIDNDYFAVISFDLNKNPDVDILLPHVYDVNGLLSPCYISGCRCRRIKGEIKNNKHLTGINSGMVISSDIKNIPHDERLFLDWVDHAFVKVARENDANIMLSSGKIWQNFSGSSNNALTVDLNRFMTYAQDMTMYAMIFKHRISCHFWLEMRCLKLCVKHRTVKFFRILLNARKGEVNLK